MRRPATEYGLASDPESAVVHFTRLLIGLSFFLQAPACAQRPASSSTMEELATEWRIVGEKTVSLARAFPAAAMDWRPAADARSVAEVIVHITGSNYWLAAVAGVPAPAATGLLGDDEATVVAYDKRKPPADSALAELAASVAHVERGLLTTPTDRLGQRLTLEGHSRTVHGTWVHTVTHAHEHLGQLIAYARANGIVPPWSR
jgi:hypothetical protein